jgi:hypothetical protein
MPSRVAVGPAQGRAVAAGAGLHRCDRGLPWVAIACGSAAAYCYCEGCWRHDHASSSYPIQPYTVATEACTHGRLSTC